MTKLTQLTTLDFTIINKFRSYSFSRKVKKKRDA